MAADASMKDLPLHDLMEGFFQGQKRDIHLYCHGHLNPKNLYSPPEKSTHKPWPSSAVDVPIPVMRQPSKLPSPKRSKAKSNSMKDAMYDFSMGTAGSLPLQGIGAGLGTPGITPGPAPSKLSTIKDPRSPTASPTVLSSSPTKSRQHHHLSSRGHHHQSAPSPKPTPIPDHVGRETLASQQRQNSVASNYVADNVYVEELMLSELMLPSTAKSGARRGGTGAGGATTRGGGHPFPGDRHQFVETHLGGITKKDQFVKFKDFQSNVLRVSEMFEKGVLSGRKAVEHLERRLYEDLVELDEVHRQTGPNFHRLQIYNNAWQSLIEDSPTFRESLTKIKAEYEVYMGSLLDTQPQKQSQVLVQQVDNLAAGSPVVPGEVKEGFKNVQQLEADAKELLEENERLRQAIRDEQQRQEDEPPPLRSHIPQSAVVAARPPVTRKETAYHSNSGGGGGLNNGVTEQILEMHAGILEQMELLKQLRSELQVHYVPISVCQHLDQCVRDTEAEVLKVLSTNEYLEKTIQQLEVEMERLMERGNTPDTDIRQIWKGINTLSISSHELL